ncbi:hypothetical protein V6N13_079497 [Hibiscus sabdariffa]|uniref:Uncharacterized protein n=1 Tax=Hibiscus sabdariffa TaxID=183260 RepID=A0ABR2RRT9_9ROSI
MGKSWPVKQAVVVVGALALGWMAFKPLLDKVRAAWDKTDPDPDHDPDDGAAARKDDSAIKNKDDSDGKPVSYADAVTKNAAGDLIVLLFSSLAVSIKK